MVIIEVTVPRTGTRCLENLLSHGSYVKVLTLPDIETLSPDSKWYDKELERIITNLQQELIDDLELTFNTYSHILIRGHIQENWLFSLVAYSGLKIVSPLRHPVSALLSILRRNIGIDVAMQQIHRFTLFTKTLSSIDNKMIIPIDIFSRLTIEERLNKIQELFDFLCLDFSSEQKQLTRNWDKVGHSQEPIKESHRIIANKLVEKANLIEIIKDELGIDYENFQLK